MVKGKRHSNHSFERNQFHAIDTLLEGGGGGKRNQWGDCTTRDDFLTLCVTIFVTRPMNPNWYIHYVLYIEHRFYYLISKFGPSDSVYGLYCATTPDLAPDPDPAPAFK